MNYLIKVKEWYRSKSTLSLFYFIVGIILFLFFLMIFGAFMEVPGKYIYWGIIMLLICLTCVLLGIIIIIRKEMPISLLKHHGIIAIMEGALVIVVSLLGAKSIFVRLLYWMGK
jgi:ABC-type multidrug transport system permease subunit